MTPKMSPVNLGGLMDEDGARRELVNAMRRIGPQALGAARCLDLVVIPLRFMLDGVSFILSRNPNGEGGTLFIPEDCEWSLWCGIAQCVSEDMELKLSLGVIMDAAAIMCRKSGVFPALRIA